MLHRGLPDGEMLGQFTEIDSAVHGILIIAMIYKDNRVVSDRSGDMLPGVQLWVIVETPVQESIGSVNGVVPECWFTMSGVEFLDKCDGC